MANVRTANVPEGVRYQVAEAGASVDIVLSLKRKNRWLCVVHFDAGGSAPIRTLANATVLDPGDGKLRKTFLAGVPADVPSDLVEVLLLYAAEHIVADTQGWEDWQDDLKARRIAAELAKAEAARVAQRAAHLGDLEVDALERLRDPKLLFNIAQDIATWGLVGERANALTIELAVVSRVTDEPISIVVKGESSGGKSFQVKAVLVIHPDDAHIDLTSMSEKGLIYDPRDYAHKILCFYEVDGAMANELAAALLRTLLSEGRISHLTVETSGSVPAGTVITKEGPTAFLSTTTEPSLEAQQETRTLSLLADDSEAQTTLVLARQALEATGEAATADQDGWQRMHEWLAGAGLTRVRIPFAERLPAHMPIRRTRVRRDFPRLLALIKASALLHQYQRTRTSDGVVVAELSDYAMVREVATVAMGRSMLGLSEKTLELIAVTIELHTAKTATAQAGAAAFVTYQELVKRMRWPRTTIVRWLRPALELGALDNPNEGQRGRQAQLAPGSYVVDTALVLPEVASIAYTDESVTWISPMKGTPHTVAGTAARPKDQPDHLTTAEGPPEYFSSKTASGPPETDSGAQNGASGAEIISSPPPRGQVVNSADSTAGADAPSSNGAETADSGGDQAGGQVVDRFGQVAPRWPETAPQPTMGDRPELNLTKPVQAGWSGSQGSQAPPDHCTECGRVLDIAQLAAGYQLCWDCTRPPAPKDAV